MPAAAHALSDDWVRVVYQFVREGSGVSLRRETFWWRQQGTEAELVRRETLLRAADAHVAFGTLDTQHQVVWVDAWDGKKSGLPRLVKVDCVLSNDGAQPVVLTRVIRNPAGHLPAVETP